MTFCPNEAQLRALLAGELSDHSESRFTGHVERCALCQLRMEQLSDEANTVQLRRPSPPESREPALESLVARLRREVTGSTEGAASAGSTDGGLVFPGPPSPDAPLGRLGPYLILGEVARGATGIVFKASDSRLGRTVALKVLHCHLTALDSERARFQREARAAASFSHDHLVSVYDVGTPADFPPYLVMEYVEGESLAQRLQRDGPLDPSLAAWIATQAALGLAAAHDRGLVHRDVKPSNIMLEQGSGRAKIADFGLARSEQAPSGLTRDGVIAGTPAYMSPEQITAPVSVDGRSDVYSLGVVLYEMLTGEVPFRGVWRMLLWQVVHDDPRPPRQLNDRIPRELETVCLKAMSKDPACRYPTAAAFAEDLDRWLRGVPVHARRRSILARLLAWSARRPAIAALTLLVLGLIVAGFAGLVLANRTLATARDEARIARDEAARQRSQAIEAYVRLIFEVQDKLQQEGGQSPLREALLREALQGLEKVAAQMDTSTVADVSTLAAHQRLGEVLCEQGKWDAARARFRTACDLARQLLSTSPGNAEARHYLTLALCKLAVVARQTGAPHEAQVHYAEAEQQLKAFKVAEPSSSRVRRTIALVEDQVGDFLVEQGKPGEARGRYQRSLEALEGLVEDRRSPGENERDLAVTLLKLGQLTTDRDASQALLNRGHALCVLRAERASADGQAQRDLAVAEARLAEHAFRQGDGASARRHATLSHDILAVLHQKDAGNAGLRADLASSLAELGRAAFLLGQLDEARTDLTACRGLREELIAQAPDSWEARRDLVLCLKQLAGIEGKAGRVREADRLLAEVREKLTQLRDDPRTRSSPSRLAWIEQQDRALPAREGGVGR